MQCTYISVIYHYNFQIIHTQEMNALWKYLRTRAIERKVPIDIPAYRGKLKIPFSNIDFQYRWKIPIPLKDEDYHRYT